MTRILTKLAARFGTVLGAAALAVSGLASAAAAQDRVVVTGKIDWGVYVDMDGCMHWWSDGGLEGYMVTRLHPETGRPYCLDRQTCMVESTDTLFATDSAQLTGEARRRLTDFFGRDNSFSYAIYGHTDSRASDAYNLDLSERRAQSVAQVAQTTGSVVERQMGFGERRPVATNATAAGMQQNRRVEVVCYRLPE